MSHVTKCDECDTINTGPVGLSWLILRTRFGANLDFCGWDCLTDYATRERTKSHERKAALAQGAPARPRS